MQSKMTEREFEAAVMEELSGVDGKLRWSVTDTAKAVALRAGLEFAPEPAVPVAALECGSTAHGWDVWPVRGHWASTEEKVVSLTAAMFRYNAYPGLREAAEALVSLITPHMTVYGADVPKLRAALSDLKESLAKGPK